MAAIAIAAIATLLATYAVFGQSIRIGFELRSARPVAERVASLWRSTGANEGSYVSVRELELPFELYSSSWGLRLTSLYHLPVPATVDTTALIEALRATLKNPGSVPPLPELEVIRRTVTALRDLGVEPPTDVVAMRLADLRVDSGYAIARGDPASLVGMSVALETYSLAGLPIPDDIRAQCRAVLDADGPKATIQEIADVTVPTWIAADLALTANERGSHVADLRASLQFLWQTMRGTPTWDGPTLSLAAAAAEVSRANGIEVPAFDTSVWVALARDDGLLGASPGSMDVDLQGTFAAAQLGRPLPATLMQTMSRTTNRYGWHTPPIGGPSDAAMATVVVRKMIMDDHRAALAGHLDTWSTVLQKGITDPESLRRNVGGVAMYNAVASLVGGAHWMPSNVVWPDLATWTGSDQQWLARAFLLSGVRPPTDVLGQLVNANNRAPESSHDALGIYLVGSLANSDELKLNATTYFESLKLGDLYVGHRDSAVADLQSTAIGYAIVGQTSFGAARRFDTIGGFSMLPDTGATGEAGTLQSAFYAFGLATGFENLAMVP